MKRKERLAKKKEEKRKEERRQEEEKNGRPVFITLPVCQYNVTDLVHTYFRTQIHQAKSPVIIWLHKSVLLSESEFRRQERELREEARRKEWKQVGENRSKKGGRESYLVNPLPSILTTIQVFLSKGSSASKLFTYSNLEFAIFSLCAFFSSWLN